uniref:Ribosomal RNA small subunit methyltransferase E n=1 Tax=Fundidesulfovibrio putealis TaxID=270496 RepID=A0A7C4AGD7_9BACT
MGRLDSFYIAPEHWREPFTLDAEESRHASKVLRLSAGAVVRCFDGQGREGTFRVESVKGAVALTSLELTQSPHPASRTWLALGWNKSARRGWLLEKAVELGAAGILFWDARRSQGDMPGEPKPAWLAQMVAGAKQSHNPFLPRIEMVPGGAQGLARRCAAMSGRWLLWESPELKRGLTLKELSAPGEHVFVLGPEGGLTGQEAGLFQDQGFVPASLGPRPLRWETAALLCLGLALWAGDVPATCCNT